MWDDTQGENCENDWPWHGIVRGWFLQVPERENYASHSTVIW